LTTDGLHARVAVAVCVNRFGLLEASIEDGIRVSTDGGITWQPRNNGLEDVTVLGLVARDQTLYATTTAGFRVSQDGGASWQPGNEPSDTIEPRAIELAGAPPRVLSLATNDHAAYALTLGGIIWRRDLTDE